MKCNKCGAEIIEGKLYCTECGEEVHMVPIFEPEVETRLDESMSRIMDDVTGQKHKRFKGEPVLKKKKHYLAVIVIVVIIGIIVCVFSLRYLFSSPEYLINRGHQCADSREYDKAIEYYEQVPDLESQHGEVLIYLARCYKALQDEEQFTKCLLLIIDSQYSAEEDIIVAYDELISLYIEKKSYQMIDSLLKDCNNKNVVKLYEKYMVSEPVFSYEAGYYREIIPLKITADENETVYYTMDGSEPTVNSEVFNMPVFMDEGEYEIKAISVNEYGVVSKVVTKEYQIEL